ncbi:MAG: Gldg family protein [Candidatus Kapabacteria bacterium]|nr:Gldg family protein [Candidatus Kapabacteria bacterium]
MKVKSSKKIQSIISACLLIGILILINIISIRVFYRLDMTSGKLYTLSNASRNIVAKIEDKLNIKAYFTEDLPAPYNNNKRALIDILNEYKAYSHGNLKFEFINPDNQELATEAKRAGIPEMDVKVIDNDKVEVKRAFLGLTIQYQDRHEILPVMQNEEVMEYDLTSALLRLIQKEKKRIAYSTGHGEVPLNTLQLPYRAISLQYDLAPVDLSVDTSISDDFSALLIIDPKEPFSDTAKYAIDKFVVNGGRVALFNCMLKVDPSSPLPYTQQSELNLDDLFENYGVKLNHDLVRDQNCAKISVVRESGGYQFQTQVAFPYLPTLTNFDKSNPIVRDLQNIVLSFPGSFDYSNANSKGITATALASTSAKSASDTGMVRVDPFKKYTINDFLQKNICLALTLEGQFPSFYHGKRSGASIPKSKDTRMVLVGSGQFIDNNLSRYKDNLTFFANIIDFLVDDTGLITIRSKSVSLPQLESTSDGSKKILKYSNMLIPPFLIAIIGLLRWRKRRESI